MKTRSLYVVWGRGTKEEKKEDGWVVGGVV